MRLEGRVIMAESGWDHRPSQSFCLVYQFRRFLPEGRRDDVKPELVQLWGHRVRRDWNPDTRSYPTVFEDVQSPGYMHTIGVTDVVKVMNFEDEGHPFTDDDFEFMEGFVAKLPAIPAVFYGEEIEVDNE